MSTDTVSISVRVPASTKRALEELARKRRMQTGESVAVSDIIRQSLQAQCQRAIGDAMQETPVGTSVVQIVVRHMEALGMILVSGGTTPDQLADKFMAEFDPKDATVRAKLEAVLPLLDALGRIGAELEIDEVEQ